MISQLQIRRLHFKKLTNSAQISTADFSKEQQDLQRRTQPVDPEHAHFKQKVSNQMVEPNSGPSCCEACYYTTMLPTLDMQNVEVGGCINVLFVYSFSVLNQNVCCFYFI